jgi:hypothetical protein
MSGGKASGRKARDSVIAVVLVIIGLGAVAGLGFYQDEVKSYVRLQGWNLDPAREASRRFLQAAARGDGDQVAAMISPTAQTVSIVRENGKVTGVSVPAYGGPQKVALKALAPSENPQIEKARLVSLDGGSVSVAATFPKVHSLDMSWDRDGGGWKLKDLSLKAASQ